MLYSRVGTGAAVRTVHLAAPAADKDQASAGAQSALTALLPSWKAAVPLPLSRSMHGAVGPPARASAPLSSDTDSRPAMSVACASERHSPAAVSGRHRAAAFRHSDSDNAHRCATPGDGYARRAKRGALVAREFSDRGGTTAGCGRAMWGRF